MTLENVSVDRPQSASSPSGREPFRPNCREHGRVGFGYPRRRRVSLAPAESTTEGEMFGIRWERAEAKIVAEEFVPVHKGDRYSHNVYVVEVRPDGQTPFRAKLSQPETGPKFAFPGRGDVIRVKCRPKSKKVRWDHTDPRSFNTAAVDDPQARLDAALQGPVSSPPDRRS
jgi:hypothetical protein